MRLALITVGQRAIFRAVPFRQPKVAGKFVFLHVGLLHDIDDRIAIG